MNLKPSVSHRDVTEVGKGDYVKIRDQWKCIESNTAEGAERAPRNWTVRTEDGGEYDMWQVGLYAKAEDFELHLA